MSRLDPVHFELLTAYESAVIERWERCPWRPLHRDLRSVLDQPDDSIWWTQRKRERWQAWQTSITTLREAGLSIGTIRRHLMSLVETCARHELPQPWLMEQGKWRVAEQMMNRAERLAKPQSAPRARASLRAHHLRIERTRERMARGFQQLTQERHT